VIKADKILVMDGGNLIEFDRPYNLLKKENGYLKKLIEQTSLSLIEEIEENAKKVN
jgi:ABC-type multidrug transport system fused ATPase/permease subunit